MVLFLLDDDHGYECVESDDAETEKSSEQISILKFLLRNPMIIFVSISLLIFNFGYIQWNFLLPLQTVAIFNDSGPKNFSFLLSINAITVLLLSPILTSVTQKVSSLKSMFIGGIFYIAAFLIFAISNGMPLFILSIFIMTIGEILIAINMNHYIALSTPKILLGRANSLIFIISGTGYAIGPAIMGIMLKSINYKTAWVIVSGITAFAVVIMYSLSKLDTCENNLAEENIVFKDED